MQVKSPSKDLIVRDLPHKICCSGYPQGEKERPISTIAFVNNATTIFPYNPDGVTVTPHRVTAGQGSFLESLSLNLHLNPPNGASLCGETAVIVFFGV